MAGGCSPAGGDWELRVDNSVFWGSLQQEHLPLRLLEGFAEPLVLAATGFPPLAEIDLV